MWLQFASTLYCSNHYSPASLRVSLIDLFIRSVPDTRETVHTKLVRSQNPGPSGKLSARMKAMMSGNLVMFLLCPLYHADCLLFVNYPVQY